MKPRRAARPRKIVLAASLGIALGVVGFAASAPEKVLQAEFARLRWLAGAELPDNKAIMQAALHAGPGTMLVTSAHPMLAGGTGNLLVTHSLALLAEHRLVTGPTNGLGDLTSAHFLARMLAGLDLEQVLQRTTASVFEIMARSAKRGADELMLEADASSLSTPMAMTQMRRLVHPSKGVRA